MLKKYRWTLLYVILAAVLLFSLFAVPGIAVNAMNETKGRIVTVPADPGR